MSKKSYGVFSWNVAKLGEAVTALEAQGHFVRGYEITKFSGYPFVDHEVLMFLEYAPDVLESWKALAAQSGMKVTAEIDMPKTPRGYGEAVNVAPVKEEAPVSQISDATIDEAAKDTPSRKSSKKTG